MRENMNRIDEKKEKELLDRLEMQARLVINKCNLMPTCPHCTAKEEIVQVLIDLDILRSRKMVPVSKDAQAQTQAIDK